MDDDRRRSPRAPVELRVEYKRLNSFFADYTQNISRGGTFIATDRPLPVGTVFLFSLLVPGMAAPLSLLGRVVRITALEQATPSSPAGMGIEFQSDSAEHAEKEATIEGLMTRELGEQLTAKLLGRKPSG